MLSATSSATQVYTALAPSGITSFEWHRDRSLRVASQSLAPREASQSLAVPNFRRLHGSNLHDFSSPKLHLGMGEDFSVKQQSELQKSFGRRPSLFCLRRRSKWENDWGRTLKRNGQVYAARQTGRKRVFGEACFGKFFHLGLLFFFQAAMIPYTVQWFDQKSGAYHTSFNHQRSDKASDSKRKNVCKSKA